MGNLYQFELNEWLDKYDIDNYVETGLGYGESLRWAMRYTRFKQLYSVDLDEDMVVRNQGLAWECKRVNLFRDYSTEFLKNQVPELIGNTLFFLDAHFAESDFKHLPYEDSMRKYGKHSMPLVDEIEIIKNNRDISGDIFILDDWCIVDPSVEHESKAQGIIWRHGELQKELGLGMGPQDILPFFEKTHDFFVDNRAQAYAIFLPKTPNLL